MSRAIERAAARRAAQVRTRVAALLAGEAGVSVEDMPGGLIVTGRGLRARWLRRPALRWLGRWS